MITLAIETSGRSGGVALAKDRGIIAELTLSVQETHSKQLLPSVKYLMSRTGVSMGDLGCVAVSLGPGSFTGLRIGLSSARGLSMGLGIKIAGIPTFDILAAALPPIPDTVFCPVVDARKSHVYTAFYTFDSGQGRWIRQSPFLVLPPEDIAAEVLRLGINHDSGHENISLLLAGDALPVHGTAIKEQFSSLQPKVMVWNAPEYQWIPRASFGAVIADRYIHEDPEAVEPIYIRRSEAEEKKHGTVSNMIPV